MDDVGISVRVIWGLSDCCPIDNNRYGFQPTAFKQMWLEMFTQIRALAPKAIIVWAPNEGLG